MVAKTFRELTADTAPALTRLLATQAPTGSTELTRSTIAEFLAMVGVGNLKDVTIASVADKQILVYDSGVSRWVNRTEGAVDATGATNGYVLGRAAGSPAWRSPAQAAADILTDAGGAAVANTKIKEVTKGSNYTLVAADRGTSIVCTAALTITVPAIGTLGNGSWVEIINDSAGTVTINGPGVTNLDLTAGQIGMVKEYNGKQRAVAGISTLVS